MMSGDKVQKEERLPANHRTGSLAKIGIGEGSIKILAHLRRVAFTRGVIQSLRGRIPHRWRIYHLDLKNIIRYGLLAPRFSERIWINPRQCRRALSFGSARIASGKVVESSWPVEQACLVTDITKIRFCVEHWVDGMAWEETGVYEYMDTIIQAGGGRVDKCETREQVVRRYACLDLLFEQVRLQLFALAYNLGNFLRRLALPKRVKEWSLRTFRVKLIKIGAKVVKHSRYVIFQMAEVLVSKRLFQEILERIHQLKPVPIGYG